MQWNKNTCLSFCFVLLGATTGFTQSFVPTEVVGFVGFYYKSKQQVKLSWQTAKEGDIKSYLVERRKASGNDWDMLGFVAPQPPQETIKHYAFTDVAAPPPMGVGVLYYRLRLIDNKGKSTVSNAIAVSKQVPSHLTAYPTVVRDSLLNLEGGETLDSTDADDDNRVGNTFCIVNNLGQPVMKGVTKPKIDVSTLRAGAYIIKIGAEQARFAKQ